MRGSISKFSASYGSISKFGGDDYDYEGVSEANYDDKEDDNCNSKPSSGTICKLIMFDQTYFRGKSVEIIDDTNDFNGINFDNAVASLKVVGNCCWVLSSNTNYHGESIFVNRNGLYKSGNDIKKIFYKASSARKI